MSSGKRVAKRSILGTRIVAPGEDGRYYPAMILAMKTSGDNVVTNDTNEVDSEAGGGGVVGDRRFSVRFEATRKVAEFQESELIGPGFQTVSASKLKAGQIVYITYCNREVQGSVVCHRPTVDQVYIRILNGGPEVKKKLEEVRLLESRKSARLLSQVHTTDFSKLADVNIAQERKRICSETSDVSGTSGRKRRGSESALSDTSSEDYHYSSSYNSNNSFERRYLHNNSSNSPIVMSECTAAMVLMSLSCSPAAVRLRAAAQAAAAVTASSQATASSGSTTYENKEQHPCETASCETSSSPRSICCSDVSVTTANDDGSVSPSTSSGVSSLGSSWSPHGSLGSSGSSGGNGVVAGGELSEEAEALLQLSSHQESDEGIVSDQSSSSPDLEIAALKSKTDHVRILYQCTWPQCGEQRDNCVAIETHVRKSHLGRHEPLCEADDDGEEEFYYTEIEVPIRTSNNNNIVRPYNSQQQQNVPVMAFHAMTSSPKKFAPAYPVDSKLSYVSTTLPTNLVDHMGMARPAHENPEFQGKPGSSARVRTISEPFQSLVTASSAFHQSAIPIAIPVSSSAFGSTGQSGHILAHSHGSSSSYVQQHSGNGKFIRLSPKPMTSSTSASSLLGSSPGSGSHAKSPHRKPRGDAKKCRKVYGMDHRDQWCTQCKWKKACTRFGENS